MKVLAAFLSFLFLSPLIVGCAATQIGGVANQRTSSGYTELQAAILNNDSAVALELIGKTETIYPVKSPQSRVALDYSFDLDSTSVRNRLLEKETQQVIDNPYIKSDPSRIVFQDFSKERRCELILSDFLNFVNDPALIPHLSEFSVHYCPGVNFDYIQKMTYKNYELVSHDAFEELTEDLDISEKFYYSLIYQPMLAEKMLNDGELYNVSDNFRGLPLLAYTFSFNRPRIREKIEYINPVASNEFSQNDWDKIACAAIFEPMFDQKYVISLVSDNASSNLKCKFTDPIVLAINRKNIKALETLIAMSAFSSSVMENKNKYTAVLNDSGFVDGMVAMHKVGLVSEGDIFSFYNSSTYKEKKEVVNKLAGAERHNLACELVRRKKDDRLSLEIVKESISVNKPCPGGELPIFLADSNTKIFKALYELGVDSGVSNSTGENLLLASIETYDSSIIQAVAQNHPEMVSELNLRDSAKLPDDDALFEFLVSKGMRPEFTQSLDLIGICSDHRYKPSKSMMRQSFFEAYKDVLAEHQEEEELRSIALVSFEKCLAAKQAQYSRINPFRSNLRTAPVLNRDIYATAKIQSIRALSMLAHINVQKRDALRARDLLYASYDIVDEMVAMYRDELRSYTEFQKEELERLYAQAEKNREEQKNRIFIGSLFAAGASLASATYLESEGIDAFGNAQITLNQVVNNYFQIKASIEREYQKMVKSISEIKFDIPPFEDRRIDELDSDGIRLLIPRYGLKRPHGSLEINGGFDPSMYTVRLVVSAEDGSGSVCTASLIKPKTLLTSKSCLFSGVELNPPRKIAASYEYLTANSGGLYVANRDYARSWVIKTSTEHFNPAFGGDWKHDWAVLEATTEKEILIPAFLKRLGLDIMSWAETREFLRNKGRVTLTGYASHLNDGEYLTMDWGCEIRAARIPKLVTACKGWTGDTGAAVTVSEGKHKGKILGVHSLSNQASDPSRLAAAEVLGAYIIDELRKGNYQTYSVSR